MVFWVQAIQREEVYAQFIAQLLEGRGETEEEKLLKVINTIAKGESCEFLDTELLPETKSYVLGLSPNEGRISVRFFYESSFGELLSHINAHYERLSIESPRYETKQFPSIQDILYETVNKNAKNKSAQPILVGALMQSVLQDTLYPAALYSHVMLRIHAERAINRNRAAILKAYLLKNHPEKREAIKTMNLNEETEYLPYVLGRMFAVLEDIQSAAIGKETLRERYFNAASSTPAVVFPQLIKLSNSHMRVLARENKGLQIVKEKELEKLFGKVHSNFPTNLSLEDQGIFMIGYYHQVQARYQKKKED
jgi:CRISPR-associated protein Csd1